MIFRHISAIVSSCMLCFVATGLLSSHSQASYISPTPDPFLNSQVTLTASSVIATPGFGYSNTFILSNFNETSSTIMGGNQMVKYTVDFHVTFYTDASLTTVSGSGVLPGNFEATIFGRGTAFQQGTFSEQITLATFSGVFGGNTLQTQLDPSMVSSGTVTILFGGVDGMGQPYWNISNTSTVNAQQVVNGVTSNVPSIQAAGASAVPEPATISLAILGGGILSGLSMLRRRTA